MSDFGFWELALIMLIALLIVGPDRLPQLVATLGRWIRRMRELTTQLKTEFAEQSGSRDVKKIFTDAQDTINQTSGDIKREFVNTDPLVKAIEDQINEGRFAATKTDDANKNELRSKVEKEETAKEKQANDHDR